MNSAAGFCLRCFFQKRAAARAAKAAAPPVANNVPRTATVEPVMTRQRAQRMTGKDTSPASTIMPATVDDLTIQSSNRSQRARLTPTRFGHDETRAVFAECD